MDDKSTCQILKGMLTDLSFYKDMFPMTKTHCVSPGEGLFPSGYLEGGIILCQLLSIATKVCVCLFVAWSHYVALVSLELSESHLPLPPEC